MTKEDNRGLLSKVVKFVKNPTTNWADLDRQESQQESGYSKQALKEMIERKKRNDFVRKREFDNLRKMRRREVMGTHDQAVRPSFFQSSMPSTPDERAQTLKKIDEIEAQMSMQWWKTKDQSGVGGSSFPSSTPSASAAAAASRESASYARTEPAGLSPQAHAASYSPTVSPELTALAGAPASRQSPLVDRRPTDFSSSKTFAVEVDEYAHDPELEEAAIRFANDDDAGAAAGLREALSERGTRGGHDETWMALFDLYRASGDQEQFEMAALDYAGRFQRSAPQWFSMPEAVSRMAPLAEDEEGKSRDAHWVCPSVMGSQTIAALSALLERTAQPWQLDWGRLNTVEPAAVQPFTRLLQRWGSEAVQLQFIAGDRLVQLLAAAAPAGDKSVDSQRWQLYMSLLRVMRRIDDFEMAALNYCVTYEVSPPAWEEPRCTCKSLAADGSDAGPDTVIGEVFHSSLPSFGQTGGGGLERDSVGVRLSRVELSGHLRGDISNLLQQLDAKLGDADVIAIDCARLIRVDFAAAGTLLNWVSGHQAKGRQIQFTEVHRLVAAFFNVIGISEAARVTLRTH